MPRTSTGRSKSTQTSVLPEGTDSPPINDGFWMRLLTVFLGYVCDKPWYRRWKKSNLGVFYVSSKLCLRCCERTRLNEARAMQLVRDHTSIPVPRVYCSFIHHGLVYILMERLPGKPLSHNWVFRSEDSKARILTQLRSMISELRNVPRPPPPPGCPSNTDIVSGIDGGQFYDGNLPKKRFWGPFSTVRDFHRDLRSNLMVVPDECPEERSADLRKLISLHEGYAAVPPVLTHGDLSANNILADGDIVTGIIDWETAAWMPAYWEYTNAWHVNPYNPYWQEEVGKFLEAWPAELEMEKLRRKFFDVY
ncbi:Protein kinase-like domain protein [Niveomyces insectorum RCEF 264]|uniref:Protein kinase-like domain protein n=1 Tax=Niveomyces insectorum RCEF 264 TaxID=1081102 RepID=A0A167RW20_9HYPO|nr:Protein kinase-like domain protein [Niveomyces insectorum RCEF 264]